MADCRKFRVGRTVLPWLVVSLVGACSTLPSEYRPRLPGGTVGFSETRLAPNRYRVEFSGNNTSSREDTENLLKQRAAEVSLQSGFSHFVVNMQSTGLATRRQVGFVPDTYLHGPDYFNRARRYSNIPVAFEGVEVSYVTTAEITMLRTDEVPQNVAAVSAVDVIRGLQPSPPLAIASTVP